MCVCVQWWQSEIKSGGGGGGLKIKLDIPFLSAFHKKKKLNVPIQLATYVVFSFKQRS